MIFLPHHPDKNIMLKPRFDKPLYYFKDVTLEKDGFKFQEPTEMEIKDTFPTCTRSYSLNKREIVMSDLFIVYVEMNKETATIFLRDNIKFVDNVNEIPNLMAKPHFISKEEFENDKKFKFYQFAKIIHSEKIKVRFNERVQKILINGDQIIFMLRRKIVIFNMFSSSVVSLEDRIVDMAINQYLYVLTEKSILIYSDKLLKKLDIERRCRYIIPTPDYIFLTRKSLIYQFENPVNRNVNEKDTHGIVYYSATGHIRGCISDEKYLYFTTINTLNRMAIYDKEIDSILVCPKRLKLSLSDNYIVAFDAHSGVMFIDKKNLSKFACKNYYINLAGVAVYKNTIAYLCQNELYIFDIGEKDNSIIALPTVGCDKFDDNAIFNVNETTCFHSKKGFKKIDVKTAKEIDPIYSNYTVNLPYKSIGMNAFYPKCKVFDRLKKISVNKNILRQIHEYENKRYEKKTKNDIDDIVFDFADNPIEILSKRSNTYGDSQVDCSQDHFKFTSSLIPSPQMSQGDYLSQKDDCCINSPNEHTHNINDVIREQNIHNLYAVPEISTKFSLSDESKFKIMNEYIRMKKRIEKLKKRCTKHDISVSKWDVEEEEESSDVVQNGLFFDEPENTILNRKDHFILENIIGRSISTVTNSGLNDTQSNDDSLKIKMKKVFRKIFKRLTLEHPILYSLPVESIKQPLHKKIGLDKSQAVYSTSSFFVKNHFDFFKRRFQPRNINEEERPLNNGIYAFIEEEFKKIVGYKQDPKSKIISEEKPEPVKKKRGGF